ncbi:MAG: sulfite exporter TauE/SafE family protein, partial [Azoarcus sp.]|nr:sulfite exporter TauE/SafE family protein [Azoarcus sp.]
MEVSQLILLALGALFAGFIDAVVGGGGLVQLPVLFSVL